MTQTPEIVTQTPETVAPAPHVVVPTREGYDRWAAIYDGEDNALIHLEETQIAALLGDVRGRTIADIGCGTGRHALRWAADGAIVTGVDFSSGMLDRARAKPGAERVTFLQHDLTRPLPLPDAAFECVTCCLVLEHIPDITALLREMGRICRPDGFIVATELHPAMGLRGISARFTDPESGVETRPASVPKQISDYVMAAIRAGLTIDHLGEHVIDAEIAARSERSRKYLGWPMLLAMRLLPTRG